MTTIVSVRRGNQVALAGDGQVSIGNTVMKGNASKVRRLYRGKVLAGFAGGTADAFTLFERFEAQLEKYQGHLTKAAVELAKDWRTDRALRRLEALLAVADHSASLIITGNGDVVEPERGIIAIAQAVTLPRPVPAPCWRTPSFLPGKLPKNPSPSLVTSAYSPITT